MKQVATLASRLQATNQVGQKRVPETLGATQAADCAISQLQANKK